MPPFLAGTLAFTLSLAAAVAAPQAGGRAGPASPPAVALTVAGMPDGAPLQVTASRSDTSLQVHVVLQREWHLYGRDVGGGQPVEVSVDRGAFAAAGALVVPMDGNGLVHGTVDLVLPLRRTGAGDDLAATMRFAVCDPLQCLPPIELAITSGPAPLRVLLVAVDDGERTQRIAAFLRERGCEVTLTTWAAVTGPECDRADVVLADSPVFGQHKGAVKAARAFPRTASPVVAVGFLGTELLEGQRVAMACGYI